jgi:hypothetical protein
MDTVVQVLPLAFVMIAGPQINSAVFVAPSVGWAKNSGAYVVGAALSITAFVTAAYLIAKNATGASNSEEGSGRDTVDVIILVLLLVLMIRVYRGRKESEPPKWMGRLQSATPRFAFILGLLLLGIFPTDIITSVTVGTKLGQEGEAWTSSLVFIGTTLLLIALPALLVLTLGRRAREFLPKLRDWMNANSWIISEAVILLFVVIELNSLFG